MCVRVCACVCVCVCVCHISGTIPGSRLQLPFPCPMDHVFDLEGGLSRPLPADTYGPEIEFKEYSFLNNTKVRYWADARNTDTRAPTRTCTHTRTGAVRLFEGKGLSPFSGGPVTKSWELLCVGVGAPDG